MSGMPNNGPLVEAGVVVSLDQVTKGGAVYIVQADATTGTRVAIHHSGTFDQSGALAPEVNKGSHQGPLPTATFHGATHSTDIFPDTFGLRGNPQKCTFLAISRVTRVPGIEFIDARPDAEKKEHNPLAA